MAFLEAANVQWQGPTSLDKPGKYVLLPDGEQLVQWVNPTNQPSVNGSSTGGFQMYSGDPADYVPTVTESA